LLTLLPGAFLQLGGLPSRSWETGRALSASFRSQGREPCGLALAEPHNGSGEKIIPAP